MVDIHALLARIAQSAVSDHGILTAIKGAYTEVGKNKLEAALYLHLPSDMQEKLEGRDIVLGFFSIFG